MYVEVLQAIDRSWFWRVMGRNHKTMLVSETYSTKGNAKRAANRLAKPNGFEVRVG